MQMTRQEQLTSSETEQFSFQSGLYELYLKVLDLSISRLVSHSVRHYRSSQSVSKSISQWASQWASQSASQWVSESVSQWVGEPVSLWVSQSISESKYPGDIFAWFINVLVCCVACVCFVLLDAIVPEVTLIVVLRQRIQLCGLNIISSFRRQQSTN